MIAVVEGTVRVQESQPLVRDSGPAQVEVDEVSCHPQTLHSRIRDGRVLADV